MPYSSLTSSFVLNGFFCFSLHTATVLIGWLSFISAFFSIIGWSLSLNNIDEVIKNLNVTDKQPDDWTPEDLQFMQNAAIFIISMLIGFYVIEILSSLFLIHGAANNKRMFLVPFLMERAIQLTYYTILWLSIGLYFFSSHQTIGYSIFTFVFGGIGLFFNFYCFMCVYSLFVLMRDGEEYRRLVSTTNAQTHSNYTSNGASYVKI